MAPLLRALMLTPWLPAWHPAPCAAAEPAAQTAAETASGASAPSTSEAASEAVTKKGKDDKEERNKESKDKENFQAIIGVLTAAGALLGGLPKFYESVVLVSRRRRNLQRIEDLNTLMQKLHEQGHLSARTMERLTQEIEAELESAADQLRQARERQEEIVEQRTHTDLSMAARVTLLYQPIGFRASLAHYVAYMAVLMCVSMAYGSGLTEDDHFSWQKFKDTEGWADLVMAVVLGGICGMWALSERKRWEMECPNYVDDRLPPWRRHLLLFQPRTISGWITAAGVYVLLALLVLDLRYPNLDFGETQALTVYNVLQRLAVGLVFLMPLHHWALNSRWRWLQRKARLLHATPSTPAPVMQAAEVPATRATRA